MPYFTFTLYCSIGRIERVRFLFCSFQMPDTSSGIKAQFMVILWYFMVRPICEWRWELLFAPDHCHVSGCLESHTFSHAWFGSVSRCLQRCINWVWWAKHIFINDLLEVTDTTSSQSASILYRSPVMWYQQSALPGVQMILLVEMSRLDTHSCNVLSKWYIDSHVSHGVRMNCELSLYPDGKNAHPRSP